VPVAGVDVAPGEVVEAALVTGVVAAVLGASATPP
jgi:hypothetical protein